MKRWLSLALAGLLTLSLTGCGGTEGASASVPGKAGGSVAESSSAENNSPAQTAEDPWGLSLSVKDVTPTGLTLVITQQGGSPTGELQYGSPFTLESYTGDTWQEVPDTVDGDWAWTLEACLVTMEGQKEEPVDWSFFCGSLSPGHYRLSKEFMDFRDTGDYDTQVYQVEFDIP